MKEGIDNNTKIEHHKYTSKDFTSSQDVRWCPGCGDYSILAQVQRTAPEIIFEKEKMVWISGIGCSSRFPYYLDTYGFHGIHGRAPAIATGVKLNNPELSVWVATGDGDLLSIGGNHFIHAARRNVDLKVICINNFIYGMTGGQVAPTTPVGATATTAPYGCFEPPFNLPYLAESSGAVYVARWTAFHVRYIAHSMAEAFRKKGFSFIEILSPCPTLYQRRNKLGDGLDTMRYYKQHSVVKNGANTRDLALDFQGEIIVGKFVDIDRPTLHDTMDQQYRRMLKDRYNGWREI